MTFYLYKTPSGRPEVLNYELPLASALGFTLVRNLEEWVDTKHLSFDADNNLVSYETELSVQDLRRRAYPNLADQMDALWHGMNNGVLPKVEPFYSDILAVKERYPKPSN
jgi:hypothetical protein